MMFSEQHETHCTTNRIPSVTYHLKKINSKKRILMSMKVPFAKLTRHISISRSLPCFVFPRTSFVFHELNYLRNPPTLERIDALISIRHAVLKTVQFGIIHMPTYFMSLCKDLVRSCISWIFHIESLLLISGHKTSPTPCGQVFFCLCVHLG